jgi:hypothetical protein
MEARAPKLVRYPSWLVVAGAIWGQAILIAGTVGNPTPKNITLTVSIEAAGLYTLILFLTRPFWLPLLSSVGRFAAIALGIFNALLIETEFWAFERFFGASGVAASPNLLLDWLLTMPWYLGMVIIFVRGQRRSRFPPWIVFLLGGLYELGADGVVGGQIIPLIIGQPVNLLQTWAFLLVAGFWKFILVYSSMVLPPTWILAAAKADERLPRRPWFDAFLPLAWLAPYTVYLLAALVLISRK